MLRIALLSLVVLATGCAASLSVGSWKAERAYGPCSMYDWNKDGVVGSPDYAIRLKKGPMGPEEFEGFQYYFGSHCG